MKHEPDVRPYRHPSGGWGSVRSLGNILRREGVPVSGPLVLLRQKKPNPRVPWQAWIDDYREIRRAIGETYPDTFYDYDRRMWEPGGFHRPLPARKRQWKTNTGKANFVTPRGLDEDHDMPERGPESLRLITLRSNDQFNTTVYSYSDRFRGVHNSRMVLMMNRNDIDRMGLQEGEEVALVTDSTDGHHRGLGGFRVTPFDIPVGCVGAYYPEANVLLPVGHYAVDSKTPAAKSIPVTVHRRRGNGSAIHSDRTAAPER